MKKWRTWLFRILIIILAIPLLVLFFFLFLFKIYPSASYKFPFEIKQQDYGLVPVGNSYVLVEHGLPYPGDFEKSSYPQQSLNGTWEMCFDPEEAGEEGAWFSPGAAGGDWTPVTIPSNYNPFNSPHKDYKGLTWFRYTFTPAVSAGENEFSRLCFSAVLLRSKVWLNGELLGSHEGGYTPFFFDVTEHLTSGEENSLVVLSDNRLTFSSLPGKTWNAHHAAWGEYGGIYRDVLLEVLPRHYVFKAPLSCSLEADKAAISVAGFVHNHNGEGSFDLTARLIDHQQRAYPLELQSREDAGSTQSFPSPQL